MRTSLRIASAVVVAVALMAGTTVAGAQKVKPEATDIGITADEIRIAIVADVETPIAPGLNQAIVDAIEAWETQVNKRGGLAGRDVVVEFYDSKLTPDEASNAFIQACESDFALVGTSAFAAINGDAIGECVDQEGAVTGLPNLSGLDIAPGPGEQPTTFPLANVGGQDFQAEGTVYNANVGPGLFIKNKLLKGADVKLLTVAPPAPGIADTAEALAQGAIQGGAITESLPPIVIADSAPQAQFTPIIDTIEREGVNAVQIISDVAAGKLLKEAQIQGVDLSEVIFYCTSQCIGSHFLDTAGSAADGAYAFSFVAPIVETKLKGVKEYVNAVGKENATANAMLAYASALNFEDIVNRIVEKDGVNALTRARIIEEIEADPSTQTQGIMHKSTVLGEPNPCFAMVTFEGGEIVRAFPKKVGSFDCKPDNVQTVSISD